MKFFLIFIFGLLGYLTFKNFSESSITPSYQIKLGAYYFDGWTGKTFHLTSKLKDSFPEREPIWGWITSTPTIMEKQIAAASNYGLSFFNFCWYFPKKGNIFSDPHNNALKLFINCNNKRSLSYCILVVNHEGYELDSAKWSILMEEWCSLFQNKTYLKIHGKPYISYYSIESLVKTFGSTEKVKLALNQLRNTARLKGLGGVTIGICASLPESIRLSNDCGVDILTGYNYNSYGFPNAQTEITSIDNMKVAERHIWNQLYEGSKKPVIPAITLNWDRRAWDGEEVKFSRRFVGFCGTSVKNSIVSCKNWLEEYPEKATLEKVAVLYAWNEYGEGAWLTPSKGGNYELLDGVKKGINFKK